MTEMKTVQTGADVNAYINVIEDEKRRLDCLALIEMMKAATDQEPKMWGSSIVGFGTYHYKYETGREGDMCLIGFASRKQELVLYGLRSAVEFESLLTKLGKHKTGKGCLYIKRLSDVNLQTLEEIFRQAIKHTKLDYPEE